MASNRVGLESGSGPPVRAATSMFLISLAKSLPRLESRAAFLCFVVAHLECPDMLLLLFQRLTHQFDEIPVHSVIARQLRVEGGRHEAALTDRDDPTGGIAALAASEDFDTLAHRLDPRSTDEDRIVGLSGEGDRRLVRVDLPAEGVA